MQLGIFQIALRMLLATCVAAAALAQVGCASGGYKLTRKYSRFVNKQNIIVRIILYVLTTPVYGITLLIDAVIFNTMDFWNGTVSANSYSFEKDGNLYTVDHSYRGEEKLRNTRITIYPDKEAHIMRAEKTIELSETESGQVEVFVDGQLKTLVDSINQLPQVTVNESQVSKGIRGA